jgi:hypothetical protein
LKSTCPGVSIRFSSYFCAVVFVIDRDRVHADGDAAFALQVHAVERLGLDVALGDRAGLEQELVGQRALAVVDVRDDAEVANVRGRRRHSAALWLGGRRAAVPPAASRHPSTAQRG